MSIFDMASLRRKVKAVLAVSATAVGAMGIFTISVPAPAHAACDQFAFGGGDYKVSQSNGATVGFSAPPNSQNVNGGNAYIVGGGGGTLDYANVGKDSDGVSHITFQIRWSANSVGFYQGTVSGDGNVQGGTTIDADQPANKSNWSSVTPLACFTPPVAPPPPPPPTKCADGSTVPAGQQCPPPPAPSELQLRYDPPHFLGITAYVGITNNDNKPPVACTYRDGINSIDFIVTGKDETPVNIPGIPLGATYHVTVTCKNGLSLMRDVPF